MSYLQQIEELKRQKNAIHLMDAEKLKKIKTQSNFYEKTAKILDKATFISFALSIVSLGLLFANVPLLVCLIVPSVGCVVGAGCEYFSKKFAKSHQINETKFNNQLKLKAQKQFLDEQIIAKTQEYNLMREKIEKISGSTFMDQVIFQSKNLVLNDSAVKYREYLSQSKVASKKYMSQLENEREM